MMKANLSGGIMKAIEALGTVDEEVSQLWQGIHAE